jgi:hypothetical protein
VPDKPWWTSHEHDTANIIPFSRWREKVPKADEGGMKRDVPLHAAGLSRQRELAIRMRLGSKSDRVLST